MYIICLRHLFTALTYTKNKTGKFQSNNNQAKSKKQNDDSVTKYLSVDSDSFKPCDIF